MTVCKFHSSLLTVIGVYVCTIHFPIVLCIVLKIETRQFGDGESYECHPASSIGFHFFTFELLLSRCDGTFILSTYMYMYIHVHTYSVHVSRLRCM